MAGAPGGVESIRLGVAIFFRAGLVDQYVCVDCGYIESYVSDSAALPEIARKYPKVDSKPGKTTNRLPPRS
jgi:hypothetical protein